jgi:hypothetical protein
METQFEVVGNGSMEDQRSVQMSRSYAKRMQETLNMREGASSWSNVSNSDGMERITMRLELCRLESTVLKFMKGQRFCDLVTNDNPVRKIKLMSLIMGLYDVQSGKDSRYLKNLTKDVLYRSSRFLRRWHTLAMDPMLKMWREAMKGQSALECALRVEGRRFW